MRTTIESEINQIKASLDIIEEHLAWMIPADSRFSVGQRVEWSRKAKSQGFPRRKIAQKGTIKAIDRFCVLVKLDGLKKITSYHHAHFNPVNGKKLF